MVQELEAGELLALVLVIVRAVSAEAAGHKRFRDFAAEIGATAGCKGRLLGYRTPTAARSRSARTHLLAGCVL